MAFSYVGSNNAVTNGATSLTGSIPAGAGVGDLLVAAYAFEGVAAGSGPWIIPNTGQYPSDVIGPSEGWIRAGWTAPSGTGVGLEVWAAIKGTVGTFVAEFTGTLEAVMVVGAWSGAYAPNGTINDGAVRTCVTAQVTGNQPAAPLVYAFENEMVIAVGADEMTASQFGTPTGYTNRVDVTRNGAGTAEATLADATVAVTGGTGPITFPNNAATTGTLGTTATLAIRPTTVAPAAGAILSASMPPDLDLGPNYVVKINARDPATGSEVSGVTVTNFSILCENVGGGSAADLEFGPFLLVPGPGA